MKTAICLLSLAFFASAGCKQPTVAIPMGSRIIFNSNEDANSFRSAVLVDVTNLGNVVKVDKKLEVIVP